MNQEDDNFKKCDNDYKICIPKCRTPNKTYTNVCGFYGKFVNVEMLEQSIHSHVKNMVYDLHQLKYNECHMCSSFHFFREFFKIIQGSLPYCIKTKIDEPLFIKCIKDLIKFHCEQKPKSLFNQHALELLDRIDDILITDDILEIEICDNKGPVL